MSVKINDAQGRWRSKTISFRMSPEENILLNHFVQLSGMTKQDYIISKLLNREITVYGNPKVYKALKTQLEEVLKKLQQIKPHDGVNDDLLKQIHMISAIMIGMKEEAW